MTDVWRCRHVTIKGTNSSAARKTADLAQIGQLPEGAERAVRAMKSELYPMIVVDEQSATALPVSASARARPGRLGAEPGDRC